MHRRLWLLNQTYSSKVASLLVLSGLLVLFATYASAQFQDHLPFSLGVNPLTFKCPTGWESFGSKCYKVFTGSHSWRAALQTCKSYGSNLVSIQSFNENSIIASIARANNVGTFWIGLNALNKNGFHWSDGTFMLPFQGYWSAFQPDKRLGACVESAYDIDAQSHLWAFTTCEKLLPFVCEMSGCMPDTFRCFSGECVNQAWVCDGKDDCNDFSDELNCKETICQFYQKGTEGIIESPRYPKPYRPNSDCRWVIEGPVGTKIELQFEYLETEKDLDYVHILSGSPMDQLSYTLSMKSGKEPVSDDKKYVSYNNFMVIKFRSDSRIQLKGFKASWKAVKAGCGETNLVATQVKQDIKSPFYPDLYYNGLECVYIITAPGDNLITLELIDMELEFVNDFLQVRDGGSPDSPLLYTYTGKKGPTFTISTGPKLYLYFSSDTTIRKKGFHITYRSGCNNLIKTEAGSFASPGNFVVHYPPSRTCTWHVETPDGQPLSMFFDNFNLANSDSVQVYAGKDEETGQAIHRGDGFSGSIRPHVLLFSNTGSFFVKFTSDATQTSLGFSVVFSVDCPPLDLLPNHRVTTLERRLFTYVTIGCAPGFHLSTGPTVMVAQCIPGGQWNVTDIPPCEGIYCGPVPPRRNADITKATNVTYRGVATYHCKTNHVFKDGTITKQARCLETGEWENIGHCLAFANCKALPEIQHGRSIKVYGNGTEASSIKRYECDPGYTLAGIPVLRCLPNGEWSSHPPVCQGAQCPHPPRIANGKLASSAPYFVGQEVEVICNHGYQVIGTRSSILCGEDRKFSAPSECKDVDECSEATSPCDPLTTHCVNTNGGVECKCKEGLKSVLQCKPFGKHLGIGSTGPNRIFVSGDDGIHTKVDAGLNTTGTFGWCAQNTEHKWITVDLKAPMVVEGLRLVSGLRRDGSAGHITLFHLDYSFDNVYFQPYINGTTKQRYVIVGLIEGRQNSAIRLPEPFEARYVRLVIEQFNNFPCLRLDYIGCQKTFCDAQQACQINNGGCDHVCSGRGGQLQCSCSPGYQLYVRNGTEEHYMPAGETGYGELDKYRIGKSCVRRHCGSPPVFHIDNGIVLDLKKRYYSADRIYFRCNIGFMHDGGDYIECIHGDRWLGDVPVCRAAFCANYPPDLNGLIMTPPYPRIPYGGEVVLSCQQKGFVVGSGTPGGASRLCVYDPREEGGTDYRLSGPEPICQPVDCGPPNVPNGIFVGYTGMLLGSVFRLECQEGYPLLGESQRGGAVITCGPDGRWDYGSLQCSGSSCQNPGTPAQGRQLASSYELGSLVYFQCNQPGYKPVPSVIRCISDPTVAPFPIWNDTTIPTCVDTLPPKWINCPEEPVYTDADRIADFIPPSSLDNSGFVHNQTVFPPVFPPALITADVDIVYTVFDEFGNSAVCTVLIRYVDTVPPIIVCPPSLVHPLIVDEEYTLVFDTVNYPPVLTRDDSNDRVALSYYPTQISGKGENLYNVTIVATDTAGNSASCDFQVYVQPVPCSIVSIPRPQYSTQDCQTLDDRLHCTLSCLRGYIFPDTKEQSRVIECVDGVQWLPSSYVPDCILGADRSSQQHQVTAYFQYKSNATIVERCPDLYQRAIVAQNSSISLLLNQACGRSGADVSVHFADAFALLNSTTQVFFQFVVNLDSPSGNEVLLDSCAQILTRELPAITSVGIPALGHGCPAIFPTDSNFIRDIICPIETIKLDSPDGVRCSAVVCPPGTYSANDTCFPCRFGYFQDRPNQQDCKQCPPGTSTLKEMSKSMSDCVQACRVGYFSSTGLPPCDPCPFNTRSTSFGSLQCIPCANGTFTSNVGSSACVPPCPLGSYSDTGLEPCRPCRQNFYQNIVGSKFCHECPSYTWTDDVGSISVAQCFIRSISYNPLWATGEPPTPVPTQALDQGFGTVIAHYDVTDRNFCLMKCQENSFPVCVGVDYSPNYGCDLLSMRLPFTSRFQFRSETGAPLLRNFDGGYFCANQDVYLHCSDSVQVLSLQSLRIVQISKYDWVGHCQSVPYLGPGCAIDDVANRIQLHCQGKNQCNFINPCTDTTKYIEVAMDCVTNPCKREPVCQNSGSCYFANHKARCDCTPGWTGEFCEVPQAPCISAPCFNGGTCQQISEREFTCRCFPGYTGSFCEIPPNYCQDDSCVFGDCVNLEDKFACLCHPGYAGQFCDQAKDVCSPNPCVNGQCVGVSTGHHQCICEPGWTGIACDVNIDDCIEQPCVGNATCHDGVNAFLCSCPQGRAGARCEQYSSACDNNPCSNNAVCLDDLEGFRCFCQVGFTGLFCESNIDPCSSAPCQNDGSCVAIYDEYLCHCPPGFTGLNCQNNVDDCENNSCRNGACVDGLGSYSCICQPGYTGQYCDAHIDFCTTGPCSERTQQCLSLINDFLCECEPGWGGKQCQVQISPCESSPCNNGGTCHQQGQTFTCSCLDGWTGPLCEHLAGMCYSSPCARGATCIDLFNDYYCVCPEGSAGKKCTDYFRADPCAGDPCLNHGTCIPQGDAFRCACAPGYDGVVCQFVSNTCESSPCKNGGICQDTEGGFNCTCAADFTGHTCESVIDDCIDHDCPPHAICLDGIQEHFCTCPFNATGAFCEKPIDPNYSLYFFDETKTASASLKFPFKLKSTAMTIAMWVQFPAFNTGGTFFTLFAIPLKNSVVRKRLMLRISADILYAAIWRDEEPLSIEVNKVPEAHRINDGQWHHLAFIWASRGGRYTLFVDGKVAADGKGYGSGRPLPNNAWISLGSRYNKAATEKEFGKGFFGHISRVNVWKRPLDPESEILPQAKDCKAPIIYDDLVLRWTGYDDVSGKVEIVHNSDCGVVVCPPGYDGQHCNTTLQDKIAPYAEFCPSDLHIVSPLRQTVVRWREPRFVDDRDITHQNQTHYSNNLFTWGEHEVVYAAYDSFGNVGTCSFKVYVIRQPCETPVVPPGVIENCEEWGREGDGLFFCTISCQDKEARFPQTLPAFFSCGLDGIWRPNRGTPNEITYPSCTNTSRPDSEVSFRMNYRTIDSCDNRQTDAVSIALKKRVYEIHTAIALCKDANCDTLAVDVECIDTRNGAVFSTRGNFVAPSSSVNEVLNKLQKEVIENNGLDLGRTANRVQRDLSSFTIYPTPKCPPGQTLIGAVCVQCAPGMYYHHESEKCLDCPRGSYQPEIGQTECIACPDINGRPGVTKGLGSTSASQCKEACSPGYYYNSTKERCTPCGHGFYQEAPAQFACNPCFIAKTTISRTATRPIDCLDDCNSGFEMKGDGRCEPCPRGHYRTGGLHERCQKCPPEKPDTKRPAVYISDCVPHIDTNFTIGTGPDVQWNEVEVDIDGENEVGGPALHTGGSRLCSPECHSRGGTCTQNLETSSWHCECPVGFDGPNCEIQVSSCTIDCQNGGLCRGDAGEQFCICPPGFGGKHCEISGSKGGLTTKDVAKIAGGVGGALICLLVIILIIVCVYCYKDSSKQKKKRAAMSYYSMTRLPGMPTPVMTSDRTDLYPPSQAASMMSIPGSHTASLYRPGAPLSKSQGSIAPKPRERASNYSHVQMSRSYGNMAAAARESSSLGRSYGNPYERDHTLSSIGVDEQFYAMPSSLGMPSLCTCPKSHKPHPHHSPLYKHRLMDNRF